MLAAKRMMISARRFVTGFSNDMYTDFAVDNFIAYDATGAVEFSDDFNRTNGPVGNGWVTGPGVAISGNKVITTVDQTDFSHGMTAGDAQLDLSFPGGDTTGNSFFAGLGRTGLLIYYFIVELLATTPTIRVVFAKGPDFSAPTVIRQTGLIDLSRTATWRFSFDGVNYTAKRNGATLLASGTIYATDTFTRPDSAVALGTADSGQVWATSSGTLGISNNQAYSPYSAGTFSVGLLSTGHADVTTQADITFSASRANVGLVTRANDSNNCLYAACASGSNIVALLKRVGGVQTLLSSTAYTVPLGDTVTMKLAAAGSSISVLVNEVPKITYTLTAGEAASFLATATKQGIEIYTDTAVAGGDDGASRWADFTVR